MYGNSLLIDLRGCDISLFNRHDIDRFFAGLCELIEMKPEARYFWDDEDILEDEKETDPRTKGTSAIQFILFSNITIHTLDLLGEVYVDVFSCKLFDMGQVLDYAIKFFDAKAHKATPVSRGRW
jgi:S-adenosylmethionine/arginine decarboxylase-like enzyme